MALTVFKNIGELLTLTGAARKQGRLIFEKDLEIIRKAAFLVENGKIIWLGEEKKLPKSLLTKKAKHIDLQKQTVLPGFVESHTHLTFAGNRAQEFELRNQGISYQEIAARGGGILSTLKQTRGASKNELLRISQERVQKFIKQGVTTLEIKSGYALNLKDEIKVLHAIRSLKKPRIIPTFLGAHALPPEFKTETEYLDFLTSEVLPLIKKNKLAQRIDIFIEKGFFSEMAARDYLQKAKTLGFDLVVHADQLSLCGGALLAVAMKARSADHLIQIKEPEIQALAHSDVTAVLLPTADLYMRCAYPPARRLIETGARVALATDFNPGSAPSQELSLVGLLARLEMKMSLPEVISAYTVGAAHALGLQSQVGSLEPGKFADFSCVSDEWKNLFYSVGERKISGVFLNGENIYKKDCDAYSC